MPERSFLGRLRSIAWVEGEGYAETADGSYAVLWNSASGLRLQEVTPDGAMRPIAEPVAGDHGPPVVRGRRIAFFDRPADPARVPTLHVHDLETGGTTTLGEVRADDLTWYDDDTLLVSHSDGAILELTLVEASGGSPPRSLLRLPAPDKKVVAGPRPGPDGRLVFLGATDQGQDLLLFDGAGTPPGSLIRGNRGAVPISARWSPDGRRVLVQIRRAGRQDLCCVDLEAGALDAIEAPEVVGPPAWSPDGRRFAVAVDDWPGTRIGVYDLAGRRLELLDGDREPMAMTPSWSTYGLSYLAFGPGSPLRLVRRETAWSSPAPVMPGTSLPGRPAPDLVRLPQPGGFDLPALVHEPRGPGGPGGGTVVLLHGGPAATWRAGWDPLVYGLTDAGHRVVQLETRGGTFRAWPVPGLPPGAAAEACDDVAACVAGLVGRGLATEGAIALMGHSHGAYLAYQASLRLPGVAAVLLSSGYLSSADLRESPDDDVRRFHRYAFDGDGDDRPARCPVLAVHGEHDLQLPLPVVAATFDRLAGDRSRFVVLPEENHAFRDRANVFRWIEACLDFLDEHLKENAMTMVTPAGLGS